MYDLGRNQPTDRTLGWGMGCTDVGGGILSNNLIISFEDSPATNITGIQARGHVNDVVFSRNHIYNQGFASGTSDAVQMGGMSFDHSALVTMVGGVDANVFSNLEFIGERYQSHATDGPVIGNIYSVDYSDMTFTDMHLYSNITAGSAVRLDGVQDTIANWVTATGATGTVTVTEITTAPSSTDTFVIV